MHFIPTKARYFAEQFDFSCFLVFSDQMLKRWWLRSWRKR